MAFSCSHRSYQSNKNKVFEFFLLPLKLLILFVWKFCLNHPNLACMLQILSVSKNLHKGSRINRSNLCLSISVCNFQSMKNPVQLNSLFSKFYCYITWFCYITWSDATLDDLQTRPLRQNLLFLWNKLSGLKITNWYFVDFKQVFVHWVISLCF